MTDSAQDLVFTLLGPDRPGIVKEISALVREHGGNWMESSLSHLAGHFAGLVRVISAIRMSCVAASRARLVRSMPLPWPARSVTRVPAISAIRTNCAAVFRAMLARQIPSRHRPRSVVPAPPATRPVSRRSIVPVSLTRRVRPTSSPWPAPPAEARQSRSVPTLIPVTAQGSVCRTTSPADD